MALQALVLPLVSVFRSAGFNEAMKALKGLDGSFKDAAKSAGFAAANFAAAGALQGFTAYVDQAVTVTQKFERNLLALNQVFEANSGQMRQFTKDAVDMGISQGQAAQASVFLGSVLKQYGVSASETVTQTQKLVGLSQDLATTYGYDLSEALVAITALFRGEYDPIEKFGVAMKQSEINALVAARGQSKLTGELLLQAQVRARLDLLYQRSADAVGAFERASGTLYVAQQKLNASMENQQIAFGQPLQEPIARVTDLFAELVIATTPLMEDLGKALGAIITAVTDLTRFIGSGLVPAFGILKESVSLVVQFFDTWGATLDTTSQKLQQLGIDLEDNQIKDFFDKVYPPTAFINSLEFLNQQLKNTEYASRAASGNFESFDNGAKRASVALRGQGYAAREAREEQEKTAESGKKLEATLKAIGTAADTASGKTSGLTQIFTEIENAAAQSEAKTALEGLGLSAGLIEKVLTQPNWAEIFGKISRLAYLTSIDLSKVFSITALGQIAGEKADIAKYLANAFKVDSKTTAGNAKDSVKSFTASLREEVNKQAASIRLAAMGASQGLIDLILGDSDWAKLWNQIKTGVISLKDLQKQFNNTAAGVRELEDALQAARDEAQAYIDDQQAKKDKLEQVWIDAKARAEDFKKTIAEIAGIQILPTIAEEVGQFEQQILGFIDSVQSALKQGFESKAIFEADYLALKAYADQEAKLLQSIARQRDDLANRYKLSKALIEEYESAFKSAASLTTLFGKLKTETEKRTVTEISKSVAQLSGSLKEFNVTVTREYEETIDKVVSKSEGLLGGFRDMAAKARSFADNLRKLKDMGLNGDLFNQLVQAGVEAGGETAQALVDGGSDTVNEINGLFKEINQLGADLGEDVAATMYGTGIDMADGLLAGIRSKQTELETLAKGMAEAFNKEFQLRVSVATDKPVAAAEAAFNNVVVPKLDDIDIAGLAQLNAFLANAGAALNVVKGADVRTGIENKIDIVETLKNAVLGGAKLDLSGIVSGLSTSELQARANTAMGITNNITVNVATDATQSNAMVGQAVANVINNYVGKGGLLVAQ